MNEEIYENEELETEEEANEIVLRDGDEVTVEVNGHSDAALALAGLAGAGILALGLFAKKKWSEWKAKKEAAQDVVPNDPSATEVEAKDVTEKKKK